MKVEIKKIGNLTGVMIPDHEALRLGLSEGKVLYLSEVKGGILQLSTSDPDYDAAMEAVDTIMDEYDPALRILAK